MSDTSDDPLSRALFALLRAQDVDMPPVVAEAWNEVSEALLAARDERNALVTAAQAAMTLMAVLDDY